MLGLAWKSLIWFLAGVAVALGFLLVPLQVAAERKKLEHTVADIDQAKRDMRSLETEFQTRASLAQLDRWNADTLKLVAPAADQFVPDEHALAALDLHARASDGTPQMMAFVPAGPVDDAATPPSAGQPAAAAPVAAPASVSGPAARAAMAAARPAPAPAHRRDLALLDRALLDDGMIGDLRRSARAETGTAR